MGATVKIKGYPNTKTTIKLPQVVSLKKFMVHFRRPSDYNGKYGFDWLRDEYIYPIINVTHDNQGTPIGGKKALCLDVTKLKTEYKDTSLSPYGKDYYPAWLSIFPHTTTAQFKHGSSMHASGVNLDLEVEELESLAKDSTELLFETNNQFLKITPEKLKLKDLIGKKERKNLGGTNTREYYLATKKVNIKCKGGTLNKNEEIKVFAKLGNKKEEVGKLILSKNDEIPKAEIVAINVISSATKAGIKSDYQYLFKNQSFNQALVRAEVKVDTEFNLVELSKKHPVVQTFLNNVSSMGSKQIKNTLVSFYETYGKHRPTSNTGKINYITSTGTTRTYLFYTEFLAGNVLGSYSLDANNNWGNSYIIYKSALKDDHTIIHEAAHSLGLPHIFQGGSYAGKHTFYHGYTENYMDYTWQLGLPVDATDLTKGFYSSGDNKFKGKMYSFYKWQWKELRSDRSLITNY